MHISLMAKYATAANALQNYDQLPDVSEPPDKDADSFPSPRRLIMMSLLWGERRLLERILFW
jgi:hypothetical protein